jgi:hypothetical protein
MPDPTQEPTAPLRPLKGSRVRVVKGRKVPIGTEGVVVWYGETQYGLRLGLIASPVVVDASGRVEDSPLGDKPLWTAADNVIVITPAPEGAPEPTPYVPRANTNVPYVPAKVVGGKVDPYAKKPKITEKSIKLSDDKLAFEIQFPFDQDLVAKVKEIPLRRWDPMLQAWCVPVTRRQEVEAFAAAHGFSLPADGISTPDLSDPTEASRRAEAFARTVAEETQSEKQIAEIVAAQKTAAAEAETKKQLGLFTHVTTPDGQDVLILQDVTFGS